ncbi:mas-related G- coupled receptor member D-like, partial [Pelobates cultripes]
MPFKERSKMMKKYKMRKKTQQSDVTRVREGPHPPLKGRSGIVKLVIARTWSKVTAADPLMLSPHMPYDAHRNQHHLCPDAYIHFTIASAVAIALCLYGIVANIVVFWLLAFRIKRSKYTVYIINLAVADFIFLLLTALIMMLYINTLIGVNSTFTGKKTLYTFIEIFYDTAQYSGMFFITAISIERCLSVSFPTWCHCYRPNNLSTIMCFLLWFVGCLESLIENFACPPEDFAAQSNVCTGVELMTFSIGVGICLPLMIISSLTLLIILILIIKLKKTFRQQYPPRLYIVIIASVIFFVLSVTPIDFLWFLTYFQIVPCNIEKVSLLFASIYCTILNSSITPYIYFLGGCTWKDREEYGFHDIAEGLDEHWLLGYFVVDGSKKKLNCGEKKTICDTSLQ